MKYLTIILTSILFLCTASGAGEIPIGNAGFESPVIAAGTFSTTSAPTNWTAFGNINFGGRTIGVLHPATTTLYTNAVPEGQNVGVIFLLPQLNQPAGMFQYLTNTLQLLTHYELTMYIGNINNDTNPPNDSFAFSGFPGYRVELLAGTNVLAVDDNSLLPDEGSFLISTVSVSIATTHHAAGDNLGIRLTNLDEAPGLEVNFDDLRLTATPLMYIEPSTGGSVRVLFRGELQESSGLIEWTNAVPSPTSPYEFTPANAAGYYRSAEDSQ